LGYKLQCMTAALDIMCVLCSDLQVEAPERVTEGHNVSLTCKSSCTLTDRATFIWYRNSQPLTERRDRNNQLLLQSVRREDAGRYSCALHGHNSLVLFNNPPKNVSVSINGSGVIVGGDSVTLSCSSDSNPPALNFSWFKGGMFVGSGRIYSISKISSDHSEEYKCRSINEHGEKYSDAVTLNVMCECTYAMWLTLLRLLASTTIHVQEDAFEKKKKKTDRSSKVVKYQPEIESVLFIIVLMV
uniref:Ig-like domain-containing protein n=1 Tax=Cyprinus carpio TaxID=7962 RepID=A0A8C1WK85_CYPCA